MSGLECATSTPLLRSVERSMCLIYPAMPPQPVLLVFVQVNFPEDFIFTLASNDKQPMITTTYALICFNFFGISLQNVGCKIRCSRIKTNLSLYMYYTRLLNICQSFLWIISALFILFSYVSSFADRLISPADSPYPQGLFIYPVKLSLRIGCSKIQANIPEGIS